MPNDVIYLNGKHYLIDDNELRKSFNEFLGDKVTDSTFYIFSNFTAPVSAECKIDILAIICIKDSQGNYLRVKDKSSGTVNFRNLILPITINDNYFNDIIEIRENNLNINDIEYDNKDEIASIKFGLKNLLESNSLFEKGKLQLNPIEYILNEKQKLYTSQIIINNEIRWSDIFSFIKSNSNLYFQSYSPWKGQDGYLKFKNDVSKINTIASTYTEYGYLTKRKIDKIGAQLSKSLAMFDSVGNTPTIIVGKAGTGKTSHLMNILLKSLSQRKNVTFLTYNHLLVKEIAIQVKVTQDALNSTWLSNDEGRNNFPSGNVQTLMKFTYSLCKKLGVLHLMSEARMLELKINLGTSCVFLEKNLSNLFQKNSNRIFLSYINWDGAIESIQNTNWAVVNKQYGIQFVRFLKKTNKSLTLDINNSLIQFKNQKETDLENLIQKEIFLKDYTGCLKNTLDVIRNIESFYSRFKVESKYELLESLMNLNNRKKDTELEDKKISLNVFKSRVKNVIKGRISKSRALIIDEGQDCHPFEREIFYELFHPNNIVVSFGGKEQLIRFSNICDWGIFKGKKIETKKIPSGNKSYRIKQSILDFCNYIANRYNIDLDLKSFSEEDSGELIFDFRKTLNSNLKASFSSLIEKGNVNGCSNLESLLIMDVNTSSKNGNTQKVETFVNEYNVLEDKQVANYGVFDYLSDLNSLTEYWIGAVDNKNELKFPAPNEVRIINYESCRGLEAWCVMCLNADKFFSSQVESDDAEKYLLNEDIYLTKEQRAAMYGITWILMAATRAIDTLYIQLSDKNNELYNLCLEYANKFPEKCTSTLSNNTIDWFLIENNHIFFNQLFSTYYNFTEDELIYYKDIITLGNPFQFYDSIPQEFNTTYGLIFNSNIIWSDRLKKIYYEEPCVIYVGDSTDIFSYVVDFDLLPLNVINELDNIKMNLPEESFVNHLDQFDSDLYKNYFDYIFKVNDFSISFFIDLLTRDDKLLFISNIEVYSNFLKLIQHFIPNFTVIQFFEKELELKQRK